MPIITFYDNLLMIVEDLDNCQASISKKDKKNNRQLYNQIKDLRIKIEEKLKEMEREPDNEKVVSFYKYSNRGD